MKNVSNFEPQIEKHQAYKKIYLIQTQLLSGEFTGRQRSSEFMTSHILAEKARRSSLFWINLVWNKFQSGMRWLWNITSCGEIYEIKTLSYQKLTILKVDRPRQILHSSSLVTGHPDSSKLMTSRVPAENARRSSDFHNNLEKNWFWLGMKWFSPEQI